MEKAHPQQKHTIFETPISTLKHVREAPGWLFYLWCSCQIVRVPRHPNTHRSNIFELPFNISPARPKNSIADIFSHRSPPALTGETLSAAKRAQVKCPLANI